MARKVKTKKARKARKAKGPKWSTYMVEHFGDPSTNCTEAKTIATFLAAMEGRGATPQEIWEAAPDAWKDHVLQEEQGNGIDWTAAADVLSSIDNSIGELPDLDDKGNKLASALSKAFSALYSHVDENETGEPDYASTPTLKVVDGEVRVSWES